MEPSPRFRACLAIVAVLAANACASAAPGVIEIRGAEAYPESVTAGPDGALYVSSLASGASRPGPPEQRHGLLWGPWTPARPSASMPTEGRARSGSAPTTLRVLGVIGPSSVAGSHLKGFDLATGRGKARYALPGHATLCNDIAVADPQILSLRPGGEALEVFAEDARFQPSKGAGLDGVAIGGDGNLYVNTFNGGELFRVNIEGGKAGAIVKLTTSY